MISSFSSKQRPSRPAVAIVTAVCMAVLVVALALVIGGCGGGKAGLVGKWYSASEAETVEFTADGKMTVTGDDGTVADLTYTTKDGQITVTVMGQTATTPYTLAGDSLTVTNLDTQKPVTYERVK
jgi:hypothetical protein